MTYTHPRALGALLALLFFAQLGSAQHALISCSRLQKSMGDSSFTATIIDVRPAQEFRAGHLPGAVNVWRHQITDSAAAFAGFRLPAPKLEKLLQRLGATNSAPIVIYDGKGNPDAARLWWMLSNYGCKSVQLLDGGLVAWQQHKFPLDTGLATPTAGNLAFPPTPPMWSAVEQAAVKAASENATALLLDARTKEEHEGTFMKKGAARAGRIPGSVWLDWSFAIDYDSTKTFLPAAELRKRLRAVGADSIAPIIAYCQSGVRSAHTTFVLTQLLGWQNVRNYDGSWIEWSQIETLPVETGPIPELVVEAEPAKQPAMDVSILGWGLLMVFIAALTVFYTYKKYFKR